MSLFAVPTQLRIWLFTQLLTRETKQEWEAKKKKRVGHQEQGRPWPEGPSGKPLLLREESRKRDN